MTPLQEDPVSTKFPAPEPPFIRARYQGGSQKPKALVLHGTVSSDDKGTARNIARWWNGPTSPKSSCHYVVDPGEVIQCVGDHSVAYHCGYNQDSIGIEFCDEQQGPASRWNDADSNAILKRAARLAAELCLAYNIEVKRPTIAELKAKGPHGIYGHNDSRLAFGRTTHTDPRDFPWKKFMEMVRNEVRALRAAADETGDAQGKKKVNTGTLADKDTPEAYFVGARGPHVKWLADRLVLHGITAPYKRNGTDRYFTDGEDRRAVREFQEAQGWTGSDADGLPGPETLRRLALDPKPAAPLPEPTPEPEPVVETPAEVAPTVCVTRLRIAHISMQFSDSTEQKAYDVEKLFQRALDRGWAWFTGTEAGGKAGKDLRALLEKGAEQNGFRFHIAQGEWVCVKRDLIKGGWETGFIPVLEPSSSKTGSRHSGRGIAFVGFNTEDLGRIYVGASHYLTKGRKKGDPNYGLNSKITEAIGKWGRDVGRGKDLVFYHGDQNIVDRRADTFRGAPFTTLWDELEKWQNTGHGNIDVIATYDNDGRVTAVAVDAFDDKRFFLYTDHFLVEGEVDIRHLAA